MNHKQKKIFTLAVLFTAGAMLADSNVAPYLNFRSVGRNTIGKVTGITSNHAHLPDMESYYGYFSVQPKFNQSFRNNHYSECLFGDVLADAGDDCDNGRSINVSGSQVTSRGDKDLMAENFYLPRDFTSTLTFDPEIRTFSIDFHFYMALDEWMEGLYFRLYGPFAHSRYDLDFQETNPTGSTGYAEGFFGNAAVDSSSLLNSFSSYAQGDTISVSGVTVEGLKFAKFGCDTQTSNCFADLRAELGYNFWLDEDSHLGLFIQAAAPTGDRAKAEFLFEPACGNGKSWELGGGVTGHYTFWRSEDEDCHFDFVFEADVTHLFNATQKRTFDLIGKGLSRYMLATKLGTPVTGLFGATGTAPNRQFQNAFSPVANFSTRDIKVDVGVQGDVVAMFNFTSRGFSWDLGYNYWGRSSENIEIREKDCAFEENTWALKGDAQVIGFNGVTPVALSATQSGATIHTGAVLDNSQLAFADAAQATLLNITSVVGSAQVSTSVNPVVITADMLNLEGAATSGSSHKIFTHFNYTWVDRDDWVPFVGIGAEVEFGKHDDIENLSSNSCDAIDCAVSQWGVWIKGGLSFN